MKKKTKRRKPSTALARRTPAALQLDPQLGPIERLARDKGLTVDKLERLIAATERIQKAKAEAAYWRDFDTMKPHLPIITKRGIIRGKAEVKGQKGPIQSRYAKFEDIQTAIAPILPRFGFVYSYRTEWPAPAVLCIVCRLKHREGHFEESRFQSPADASGGKNAIQGLGSANSYGKRYTIKDLLDLQEQGVDDDGNLAGILEKKDPNVIDAETVPPAGPIDAHHKQSTEPITDGQRKRLLGFVKNSGRIERDVLIWIGKTYNVKKLSELRRCDYDQACAAIQSPAELPKPGGRQPGEEG